jgi:hypothetical protein
MFTKLVPAIGRLMHTKACADTAIERRQNRPLWPVANLYFAICRALFLVFETVPKTSDG